MPSKSLSTRAVTTRCRKISTNLLPLDDGQFGARVVAVIGFHDQRVAAGAARPMILESGSPMTNSRIVTTPSTAIICADCGEKLQTD